MRKDALYFSLITLVNLLIFAGIFAFLQDSGNYLHTLGKISKNYERTGSWDKSRISKVSKPYQKINEEKLSGWDADIYNCIKEHMYSNDEGCYSKVRGAFFPLFPLLWRWTHTGFQGISLINYLLFSLSIGLLIHFLSKAGSFQKAILFALLISLPSTVIFYIPYSEALFLFTMTLAVIGLTREKYSLYFIGSLLLAMVRPASLFILIAVILVEVVFYAVPGNSKKTMQNLIRKALPFFTGFILVWLIQFVWSSSWTTFMDAGKHWEGGFLQTIKSISDWSVEGFALSSFSLFFVCFPAMAISFYSLIKRKSKLDFISVNGKRDENDTLQFLFLISTYYLAGILAFTLFTSGGNLHSFFRFTLASPPFYILSVLLFNKYHSKHESNSLIIALFSTFFLVLFLYLTTYGGNRTDFSFWGMYLFILNYFFFLLMGRLRRSSKVVLLITLVFLNLIWNTYMFNIFLSKGWIFT